jgi:hypothetical protein
VCLQLKKALIFLRLSQRHDAMNKYIGMNTQDIWKKYYFENAECSMKVFLALMRVLGKHSGVDADTYPGHDFIKR